ncbi:type II toxin-antitoxin system RelB/DinJ family antitoxin [Rothia aerolata]|uniref:DNA-damage-inducible protein J n=1 Tax=Rothia aerolata TaxID=1812262 RepID=A0A917IPI6_9MICC|nr:type II toxin-antitoxin system RelB/DinJ family antitoxin [Rothia aerolata]GGH57945.1 DNA-damage-inducible protein J [Rothia aerolata]
MSTTSISVRMDSETKKEGEALFKELGLNMSTAINMFVKQAVRENRIPFTVGDPRPNAESLEAIRDREQFLASGKKPRFSKAEELFEDLGI